MDDSNKPANAVAEISTETLTKLASREEDIRQSGLIDIFEQHLPAIPQDYVCSGLMYPDTDLGENARHREVFDEQAKTYVFP